MTHRRRNHLRDTAISCGDALINMGIEGEGAAGLCFSLYHLDILSGIFPNPNQHDH